MNTNMIDTKPRIEVLTWCESARIADDQRATIERLFSYWVSQKLPDQFRGCVFLRCSFDSSQPHQTLYASMLDDLGNRIWRAEIQGSPEPTLTGRWVLQLCFSVSFPIHRTKYWLELAWSDPDVVIQTLELPIVVLDQSPSLKPCAAPNAS